MGLPKSGTACRAAPAGTKTRAAPEARPLTAHRFAEVRDVIGPCYVGRDGDVALAVWGEAAAGGRSLLVAPVDSAGIPGKPMRIGTVAPELDLVLARGLGAAGAGLPGKPRFALVTTRRGEQKTSIDVTATTAAGVAVFGPTNVAERARRA